MKNPQVVVRFLGEYFQCGGYTVIADYCTPIYEVCNVDLWVDTGADL